MNEQQWFINRMQEHLHRRQIQEDLYTKRVEYNFESQEIRFIPDEEPQELPFYYRLGKELFELHEASVGFHIPSHHPLKYFGKWPDHWQKRIRRALSYRDHLLRSGIETPFEEMFLQNFTYFHQLALDAIYYLEDHDYPEVVKEEMMYGTLAYRNLSLADVEVVEGSIRFIHPENWVMDIPVRDLGQFVKNTSFEADREQSDIIVEFLKGYQHKRSITPYEWHMIFGMLLFPGKFFRLADEYFAENLPPKRDWDVEIKQLLQKFENWERMLAHFPEMVYKEFGIRLSPIEWLQVTS